MSMFIIVSYQCYAFNTEFSVAPILDEQDFPLLFPYILIVSRLTPHRPQYWSDLIYTCVYRL